jgi:hypothetical protein
LYGKNAFAGGECGGDWGEDSGEKDGKGWVSEREWGRAGEVEGEDSGEVEERREEGSERRGEVEERRDEGSERREEEEESSATEDGGEHNPAVIVNVMVVPLSFPSLCKVISPPNKPVTILQIERPMPVPT